MTTFSGTLNGNQAEMTLKELADNNRIKYNTLWKKAGRKFPSVEWKADTEVTPEHAAELLKKPGGRNNGNSSRKKSPTVSPPTAKEQPEATPAPSRSWPTIAQIRHFAVGALLVSVVVCHAGLVWYDCAHLYGWAGFIGGLAVFLVVLAAVLLASDPDNYGTSEAALWFIFIVDCAAWWVHFPVFQTPDISDTITGALCAFICASSFVALYLFRDFKLND